jgi:uncharacterized integral membrane protein
MSMQQYPSDPSDSKSGRINAHIVVAAVIVVALLVFIFQNGESKQVDFLMFSFSAPLWLIIALAAVLGALLDGVVVRAWRRMRGKNKRETA